MLFGIPSIDKKFLLRTSFWGAEFFYVYDGDGNIVRSIDISGEKEYNYEYVENWTICYTSPKHNKQKQR